ncbi:hypothetical protein MJO29_010287 [Puccinia striiformis f. sp. tritici]|nr:hypothetical protein MJO29_010287 [Puccinia striiformis f. sp. tritici]
MAKTTNSKRKRPNPVPESSSEDNSSPGIQVETAPVEESQQEISATPTSAATPTPAKASTASLPSQSAKDGSPSDSTSQAKKPRSDVWIHFKKQGNGANTKATCNYCKTAMNGQSVNGTSTLWRHLTRCHSYKTSSKQALLKLNGPNSAVSNWVFSQEVSRDLLVKMVIAHELPFRFVQYALFRAFVASLHPKFKPIGRTTLKSDIMATFQRMKVQLAKELANVDKLALTTDLWTSSHQTPFMVISAHYISSDWTLKKQLIAFKELPAPHTGKAIGDQLMVAICEWKLVDKVAFITVDNASSNDVAIDRVCTILKERSRSPPLLDGAFFHVRCAAHIINLVVKDGLKQLTKSIDKIRESVRYVKSTSSRIVDFSECIQTANIKKQALPSVDVPTRWNSTYLMLRSAVPYQEAFNTLSMQDANFKTCPTPDEWEEISTMREFLAAFFKATQKLGMTRFPTAHSIYKTMKQIDKQLDDGTTNRLAHIVDLIKPMQAKYDKYWTKMEEFAEINIIFDPRCKLAIIEFMLIKEVSKEEATQRLDKIKSNLYRLYAEFTRTQTPNPEQVVPAPKAKAKTVEATDNDFNRFLATKNPHQDLSATGELDLYLQDPPAGIASGQFDILKWWSVHKLRFPMLAKLAKMMLMTPATSIASESAFLTSGRVLGDFRTRMAANTLEALVCAQDWIRTEQGLHQTDEEEDEGKDEDGDDDDVVEL